MDFVRDGPLDCVSSQDTFL